MARPIDSSPLLAYYSPLRLWITAGPRACGLLRAVALITIVLFGGVGLLYTLVADYSAYPFFLVPIIVGLIYLACARRIARGQGWPAFLGMILASLHAGLLVLYASLLCWEVCKIEWVLAHPKPGSHFVPDPLSAHDWLLVACLAAITLAIAVMLTVAIIHLARYLRDRKLPHPTSNSTTSQAVRI